jgi:ABC-type transporter Mla subunit MlaD
MSISVAPDVLLDARRVLLRLELALTSVGIEPPGTGDTTELTVAALERVAATVAELAADLRDLADALAHLVDDLRRSDDGVTAWFDLLRAARLA